MAAVLLLALHHVYGHTDSDRLEMVSSGEMATVGVCAAVSAMKLTTADATVASYLVGEVEQAALDRLATEEALSREAVAQWKDAAAERTIAETWASWYGGALASMDDIEVGGSSDAVRRRIADARAEGLSRGGRPPRRSGEARAVRHILPLLCPGTARSVG